MIFYYLMLLFSAVPNHPWFGADVGGITVIKLVGFATLAYATFYLFARKTFPPLFSTWPVWFFLLLLARAFASYMAINLEHLEYAGSGGSPMLQYFSITTLFFTTITLVDSPVRLRRTVLAVIGAIGIASLYTVREWQIAGFQAGYRPGWVAGDSNNFAGACLLTLPLCYYIYRLKGPRWERLFCLGNIFVTVLAFVAASSRGGLAGLAISFFYVMLRSKRRAQLLIFALLLVPFMVVAPSSPIRRIMNPDFGDQQSTEMHHALWAAGLQAAVEHPFLGIGLGAFKGMIRHTGAVNEIVHKEGVGLVAHNSYIEYAAELGLPAFLCFLGLLISAFLLFEKLRKTAGEQDEPFMQATAVGVQSGLVGFAGAAFFFSAEYIKPFWVLVFVAPCMYVLLKRKAEKVSQPVQKQMRYQALPNLQHSVPGRRPG